MTKDHMIAGALPTIEKYITALKTADTLTMEAMRTPDFVLDWVHADAFQNNPLTHQETNRFWPAWFRGHRLMENTMGRCLQMWETGAKEKRVRGKSRGRQEKAGKRDRSILARNLV